LTGRLRDRIAREGPIRFDHFMEAALYDPHAGYYATARAAIGRGGDYFTNASVGALFGTLIAHQLGELGAALGGEWSLVEQGAFDGQVTADILAAGCRPPAAYAIVEPFPSLEAKQRSTLARHPDIRWTPTIQSLAPFRGIHFSNELADAFPVRRFVYRAGRWLERKVAWNNDRFAWTESPAESATRLPEDPVEGDEIEVAEGIAPWIEAIGDALSEGYLLLLDYGDWNRRVAPGFPTNSSLACYRRHVRSDDPLVAVGELDITARVDFTRLRDAAKNAGFTFLASADQHRFMVGLGSAALTPELAGHVWPKLIRQYKTLMHPELMGRSFKALLFAKGAIPSGPFSGFQFADGTPEPMHPGQASLHRAAHHSDVPRPHVS
jgi:SAM-dependent MidA family methyltransferase